MLISSGKEHWRGTWRSSLFVGLCLSLWVLTCWGGVNITIEDLNKWSGRDVLKYSRITGQQPISVRGKQEFILVTAAIIDARKIESCCVAVVASPAEKKAKRIDGYAYDVHVMDLDGDGVSEIERNDVSVGQGYTIEKREIFQIVGVGIVKLLHSAKAEGNDGLYDSTDDKYKVEKVLFEYRDLDGDGVRDLIERWTVEDKRGSRSYERRFLFKKGAFKEMSR